MKCFSFLFLPRADYLSRRDVMSVQRGKGGILCRCLFKHERNGKEGRVESAKLKLSMSGNWAFSLSLFL